VQFKTREDAEKALLFMDGVGFCDWCGMISVIKLAGCYICN